MKKFKVRFVWVPLTIYWNIFLRIHLLSLFWQLSRGLVRIMVWHFSLSITANFFTHNWHSTTNLIRKPITEYDFNIKPFIFCCSMIMPKITTTICLYTNADVYECTTRFCPSQILFKFIAWYFHAWNISKCIELNYRKFSDLLNISEGHTFILF